jgi:hypothetical protein
MPVQSHVPGDRRCDQGDQAENRFQAEILTGDHPRDGERRHDEKDESR